MNLLKTNSTNTPILIIRVVLASVIFAHGAQKLFGWFGGSGFESTMNSFLNMGLPWIVAFLVIIIESVGAVSLFIGFLSRIAALGIGCVMAGAAFVVHLSQGFFMNWHGNKSGEGFEYHLLAIAMAIAVIIAGGGKWSVDAMIVKNKN